VSAWLAEQASRDTISLQLDQFLKERQVQPENAGRDLPGIPAVRIDGYLDEALSISLDYAGRYYLDRGAKLTADKRYPEALRAYARAAAADPNSAEAHFKHGWLLATCPESRYRNGKSAVERSLRACELNGWDSWQYILGLAVSEAEAGDFTAAQKHLTTALQKAPEDQRSAYSHLTARFKRRQAWAAR
jgi:tetratricopeptide (TPR) repeat protein